MVTKPSSLAQQLANIPVTRKGPRCGLAILLEQLSDADREALIAALADERATGPFISRTLNSNGHRITTNQIGRHRRKECACP